jgi:hypothetical protein
MSIDLQLLRRLLLKAEKEAPFKINPRLPVVQTSGDDPSGSFPISIQVPGNEGDEFIHWRLLADLDFVRVRHDGLPGFGPSNNEIHGLTAKGHEFAELSRDDATWATVIARCVAARACTVNVVISELRREARARLIQTRKKPRRTE